MHMQYQAPPEILIHHPDAGKDLAWWFVWSDVMSDYMQSLSPEARKRAQEDTNAPLPDSDTGVSAALLSWWVQTLQGVDTCSEGVDAYELSKMSKEARNMLLDVLSPPQIREIWKAWDAYIRDQRPRVWSVMNGAIHHFY